jgi:hypothetical protein
MQPKEERILYENFSPQRIISYQIFDTPDYGVRCALQVIVKLEATWLSTTGKAWEKAQTILINGDSPENAVDTFTPGTGGSIPSTINTHAKLALWCGDAAAALIYKEAEKPDSIVFKTLDNIDRKLKGGNQYKLGNETKTRSAGGVQISPEVLPFQGGQVAARYWVVFDVKITNRGPDGAILGEGFGTNQAFSAQGPIQNGTMPI